MYAIILAALLSFQTSTVQGTWVNIDDETGVEKSRDYPLCRKRKTLRQNRAIIAA